MLRIAFIVFYALSFVLLQNLVPNFAQVDSKMSDQEIRPFTDLTLEITAPSPILLRLQPIPIIVRQSNSKNENVLGYSAIGFGKSPLSMAIRKTGNARWIWINTTPLRKFSIFTNVAIIPGANLEAKEWLTLGLHKYFPEPGSYELQAVLANDDRTQFIESNILTIELLEPTGTDRLAYTLIKNSSFQDYLFAGSKFDRVKNTLERLNTLYLNSPYARSASFVLGENYFHGRNYPQALANLLRLENDNSFIHADKVRKYLTEIRRINPNLQPEVEKP